MADMSHVEKFLQSCHATELTSIAQDALAYKDRKVLTLAIHEMVRRNQEAAKAETIKPVSRRKQKDRFYSWRLL